MKVDEKGLVAAIDEVLRREAEFRAIMPADWEPDPLHNAISDLRTAYESARSAEPVAWRLLQNGEIIEAADQVLADDTVTWLPLQGWEIGLPYYSGIYVPARRAHPTLEASDV